jgi:hypothetical protein
LRTLVQAKKKNNMGITEGRKGETSWINRSTLEMAFLCTKVQFVSQNECNINPQMGMSENTSFLNIHKDIWICRLDIQATVLGKIQIFWDFRLCRMVISHLCLGGVCCRRIHGQSSPVPYWLIIICPLDPEDGSNKPHRKFDSSVLGDGINSLQSGILTFEYYAARRH